MDFMLIMLVDREVGTKPEVMAEMGRFAGGLAGQGKLKGGAPLKPEEEGARVRARNRKPIVSDGPFLETKEVIGGYFLIECSSQEEALEIAKQCPHALHGIGPVEVREIIPMGPRA
jgi:hypothetical protein